MKRRKIVRKLPTNFRSGVSKLLRINNGTCIGAHVAVGDRDGYEGENYIHVTSFEHGAIVKPSFNEEASEVKENCITVNRYIDQWSEGEANIPPGFDQFTPQQARDNMRWRWYNTDLRDQWRLRPSDYIQLTNEYGTTPEEFERLIAFEDEAVICNEETGGEFKFALMSCAGDSPSWNSEIFQNQIAPFLIKSAPFGHVYSRHAYCDSGPYATDRLIGADGKPSNPNMNRPFQEIDYMLETFGWSPALLLTECGWVTFPKGREVYVVDQYEQFSDYIIDNGYHKWIAGFCTFTFGKWWNADQQSCAPLLNQLLERRPYVGWTAPPVGDTPPVTPPLDCTLKKDFRRFVHLIPQDTTTDELLEVVEGFHETRNSFVYSHDDAEVIIAHGRTKEEAINSGKDPSEVLIWNPERWSFDIIEYFESRNYEYSLGYFNDQPVPPPVDVIDMVIYGQRDSRWSNHILGQPTGHGETIGSWGCLITVYAMMADYYNVSTRLPDDENDYYVTKNLFTNEVIHSMAFSRAYTDIKNEGWLTLRDHGAERMHTKIRNYLNLGRPVAARVDLRPDVTGYVQHWIALTGYDEEEDDYLMNDPYYGNKNVYVKDYFNSVGEDILEAIFYYYEKDNTVPPPSGELVDMLPYFFLESGHIYGDITIKDTNWGQGQVRQQIQVHVPFESIITKGNEREIRRYDPQRDIILFELDDSPGDGKYYLVDSATGWLPRYFRVGTVFQRTESNQFFYKANCNPTGEGSNWNNQIKFVDKLDSYTVPDSGLVYKNVAHLQWILNGVVEEDYYMAKGIGYIDWRNKHGRRSHVVEHIPVGQQGNNVCPETCYAPAIGVEYP